MEINTENSENLPKVLVASPVYKGMKYCIKQFIDRIKSLIYSNYKILLIDNSDTNEFFDELKSLAGERCVIKDSTKGKNMEKIANSRNKAIDYALENNYEYILMMDCDVIPPANIIQELLKCEKDIVSGLYFNYFQSSGKLKVLPVAWMPLTDSEFEQIKNKSPLPPSIKSPADLKRHLIREEFESNKVLKVAHPSAGCMLISKKVFSQVRYGILDTNIQTTEDIYFIKKAREAGFEPYCHTGLKCEHLVTGKFKKDKDGNLENPAFS